MASVKEEEIINILDYLSTPIKAEDILEAKYTNNENHNYIKIKIKMRSEIEASHIIDFLETYLAEAFNNDLASVKLQINYRTEIAIAEIVDYFS